MQESIYYTPILLKIKASIIIIIKAFQQELLHVRDLEIFLVININAEKCLCVNYFQG